ncbi:MAG: hypothetical protein IJR89_06765, partial [Clostridia bacterium]|nr:hypothetical protein [Clostridia bacterium]
RDNEGNSKTFGSYGLLTETADSAGNKVVYDFTGAGWMDYALYYPNGGQPQAIRESPLRATTVRTFCAKGAVCARRGRVETHFFAGSGFSGQAENRPMLIGAVFVFGSF